MGRKAISTEERLSKLGPRTQADLAMAIEMHRAAVEAESSASKNLRAVVQRALAEGASYRDLEAMIGVPRTTINALVRRTG